jgi:DNA adenine methylase
MILLMRYHGGKGKAFQKIINLMPVHRVYIETHLGGGAVLRNKLPVEVNIGVDVDPAVIYRWQGAPPHFDIVCADALRFLQSRKLSADTLVYSDPPYPAETRRSSRRYRCDYTLEDHRALLEYLRALPCNVMVSSYPNSLYEENLRGWNAITFQGTSHTGRRTEVLWMNFRAGIVGDYRFLGISFRQRQQIKRLRTRWSQRFGKLSKPVRQALLGDLCRNFVRDLDPAERCGFRELLNSEIESVKR